MGLSHPYLHGGNNASHELDDYRRWCRNVVGEVFQYVRDDFKPLQLAGDSRGQRGRHSRSKIIVVGGWIAVWYEMSLVDYLCLMARGR